jgi:uncharacterized protein
MKLSRYTKRAPSPKDPHSCILFSTVNAAAILVPSGLITDIESGSLPEEERESLANLGFITDDDEREKRQMLEYISGLNAADTSVRLIVVLNLDCNLACAYCFEGGRKGKFYLSETTAAELVEFVKKKDFAGKEEIQVTFYGGEPLLSTGLIETISRLLLSFAEKNGLRYAFSLVTNGTLLTPGVVRRLAPLGLKGAKVTLDGPKHIHNRFRPFKSGAGSFDVTVRNIRDVCELITIQVGGNYTREQYREFPRLLDYFTDQGLGPEKIPIVKFDPVISESREFAPADFHDGCESINEPWVSEAALFLRREILKRGYRTKPVMPSPCLVELYDSVVVNYDGTLYKCPGLIGRKNCCVGDLRSGLRDYRGSHGLDAWKNDECLACTYLPLCFGGCKYMQLIKTGTMNNVDCRKEYFDRSLAELIMQDVEYNL